MKTKVGLVILSLVLAVTLACNSSQVHTYVDLAVNAVNGGLSLAQSFGAKIDPSVTAKVTALGSDVESAVAAWASASADAKPGKWAAVETALDAFKTYLPQVLQDAGVPAQYTAYAGIVTLAITAVEAAVNIVEQQNPAAGKAKATAPLNVSNFKKQYNQQMVAAGHSELQLK